MDNILYMKPYYKDIELVTEHQKLLVLSTKNKMGVGFGQ